MENENQAEAPLDPIALTLALWLGFVVCATGLSRLEHEASAQAALDEAAGKSAFTLTIDDAQLLAARAMAYGG